MKVLNLFVYSSLAAFLASCGGAPFSSASGVPLSSQAEYSVHSLEPSVDSSPLESSFGESSLSSEEESFLYSEETPILDNRFAYDIINPRTCVITDYLKNDASELAIPRKLNGYLVVGIGYEGYPNRPVFKGHGEITRVEIPESVHVIGPKTFAGTGISQIYLPSRVAYVGKDCFKDCSSLTSILSPSEGPFMHPRWDPDWNSGNVPVTYHAKRGEDIIEAIAEDLVKDLVTDAAKEIASEGINNLLSLFGYKDPEEVFKTETLQSLSEIKKAIADGFADLSNQIQAISDKVDDLRHYVEKMELEVFARVDRSEFDTRMSVLGSHFSTIDTLYDGYLHLKDVLNYDVLKVAAKELIANIEDANLPVVINFLQQQFCANLAGSIVPLLSLYNTYLQETFPFQHEIMPKLNDFAEFYRLEILKAVQLYTEYCNYEQAVYSSDRASQIYWRGNAKRTISSYMDTLDAASALIPEGDYTLNDGSDAYHISSIAYGFDFHFSTTLFPHDRVVFYEAADKGPDYYFCNPGQICGPGQNQYLGLDKARQLFNPNIDLLSFINSHCGTSITSTAWGCQPGEFEYDGAMYSGCAVINLNDVNTLEFDATYGQDVVRTW